MVLGEKKERVRERHPTVVIGGHLWETKRKATEGRNSKRKST